MFQLWFVLIDSTYFSIFVNKCSMFWVHTFGCVNCVQEGFEWLCRNACELYLANVTNVSEWTYWLYCSPWHVIQQNRKSSEGRWVLCHCCCCRCCCWRLIYRVASPVKNVLVWLNIDICNWECPLFTKFHIVSFLPALMMFPAILISRLLC